MNLDSRLAKLSPAQRALLEKKLREKAQAEGQRDAIPKLTPDDVPLLSFAEQRLWFVDQLEPDHPFYNMPLAARLRGELNRSAFSRSLQAVVERHETLRSSYRMVAGAPQRFISESVVVTPQWVDVRGQNLTDEQLRRRLRIESRRPFVLETGPLLRCTLFQLADEEHVVLLTMHHIVSDGWSMSVMLEELAYFYRAFIANTSPNLPPLSIQYSDFANWQQAQLKAEVLEKEVEYWRDKLAGAPELIDLPTTFSRPAVQDFEGATTVVTLSAELSSGIDEMALRLQATPFMVLLAAYAALLSRYSKQVEFCIGTAVANRVRPELERLIGFFVNTLVIRTDVSNEPSFEELVLRVRDTAKDAYCHQEIPFEKLVEELIEGRDRSHSPLFQVAMVLQNAPRNLDSQTGVSIEPIHVDNGTSKSDLALFLWQEAGQYTGYLEYRTSLFSSNTIERISQGFIELLEQAIREPGISVAALPIIGEAERRFLIEELNATDLKFSRPQLLHQLFEEQVRRLPDQPAIRHGDSSITYVELNRRAERVAAALQNVGVGLENSVIVLLPRSIAQVVASLGIMKAGGVYVPIDPELPDDRLNAIFDDVQPKLIISDANVRPSEGRSFPIYTPEQLEQQGVVLRSQAIDIKPENLVYTIFTSGSTGIPKGVQIEHRGIVNFLLAKATAIGPISESDRVMHGFSPCFDGAIAEVFLTLSFGATLVIVDRKTLVDPQSLTALLNKERVSIGMFAPTLLNSLDSSRLPFLRSTLSAGEALTPELARKWMPGRRFFNGYGPTEVSIGVSIHELREPLEQRVPIGRAMANMQMYILDENQSPVPTGITGEIYIGGKSVGRGYLNRPELTSERFVPDPFAPNGQGRMYRTGDLGRWNDDGLAEFMGRRDDQVKLRGFRIELGEIEAVLNSLPDVRQSVVIPWGETGETKKLIAYVVSSTETPLVETQQRLEDDQIDNWRQLFEQSHRNAGPGVDPQFDIAGWVSTYDGQPIDPKEMRQWVDETVSRIKALKPSRVLEIGCGTGLLLFRVAGDCHEYVGTDLLPSSLAKVRHGMSQRPELTDRVRLFEQTADDFRNLPEHHFDVIVLNSVIQYFPSAVYLAKVLSGARRVLVPGGRLFIGDIRNLRLQETLATSIELHRAEADVTSEQLHSRMLGRLDKEEELLVDPQLFYSIKDLDPSVSKVTFLLKAANNDNELSRFRYDVVIEFDTPTETACETRWPAEELSLSAVAKWLQDEQPKCLSLKGIPNERVQADFATYSLVKSADKSLSREDLIRKAAAMVQRGFDPNEFYTLGASLGYDVSVAWDREREDCVEVHFQKAANDSKQPVAQKRLPMDYSAAGWNSLVNAPLRGRESLQFVSRLRSQLQQKLPDYMIPSGFVQLSQLPLTIQGKVDKKALPCPPVGRPEWAGDVVAAADQWEVMLVEIWQELLDVTPISVTDSFFDLGGHSMLAVRMVAEVSKRCERNLPLAALFRGPTIRYLATLLRNPDQALTSSSLIPLQVSGDQTPLFCVHPAGGTVFCYQELATFFVGKRPVYGLQALGVDGMQSPHQTLAEMAAHYARTIREVQPIGPYHLVGWSLGGVIAFEVARQLCEQGEPMGTLALLDSGLMDPAQEMSEDDFLPLMMALFPGDEHLSLEDVRKLSPQDQVKYFVERAAQAGIVPIDQELLGMQIFEVFQANVKVVQEYLPQAFPGKLTLFRPNEQTKTSDLFDDLELGWRPYATGGVDVVMVPGDHAHMLHHPAVDELARCLDRRLC